MPAGFSFNQYLIVAEEPLLFHCGPRMMFPLVSAAPAKIVRLERLRWIAFGHVEADECGSLHLWLEAAPKAQITHGHATCMVSLNDLTDRAPRALANDEVPDIGGRRARHIDTPHVPHARDSGLIDEEITDTPFCGDLVAHFGRGPATAKTTSPRPLSPPRKLSRRRRSRRPPGPTIRMLAALRPCRLAVMHGSRHAGDCSAPSTKPAEYYERALAAKTAAP